MWEYTYNDAYIYYMNVTLKYKWKEIISREKRRKKDMIVQMKKKTQITLSNDTKMQNVKRKMQNINSSMKIVQR